LAFFSASWWDLSRREQSIGVSVSEMKPDSAIAMLIVMANSKKKRPTMPPMNRIGMNTATSDRVMDSTVKPISLAPLMAASNGFIPCST
jgi:hypothetical protein